MAEDDKKETPITLIVLLLLVIIGLVSVIVYMMYRSKRKQPWSKSWSKSTNQIQKRFSQASHYVGDTISDLYVDTSQYFRKRFSSKKPSRYSIRSYRKNS